MRESEMYLLVGLAGRQGFTIAHQWGTKRRAVVLVGPTGKVVAIHVSQDLHHALDRLIAAGLVWLTEEPE